ncbi:MAG: ferrous iron transporter B, partial [Bacteroidaceae bacterium]|nr:ferrous iron transporter B [Bacteroidaceae bacterium]
MSFGCSASAVLTSRAVDDQNLRIKTAMLAPYMSCSAKLPIYAVLGGAFFGASNVFVIMLLYLIGVFTALLISLVLEKFLKSKSSHFLMEFPPYKFPSIKKIFLICFQNMKVFLIKVTTIFVSMSIIIWCLGSFDFSFRYVAKSGEVSMLEGLGGLFAPFFAPLGFDNP